jgi:streptomycin 6-kinase
LISTVENWWIPSELTGGWLDSLPDAVESLTEKWEITFDPEVPESNVTLVLLGNSKQLGPVVFKSSPIADEFRAEAAALKIAGGESVSRLFDLDIDRSAMIVERIVPGHQLRQANLSDEDATTTFAKLATKFWREAPDPTGLHALRNWMGDLYDWQSRPERIPDATIELAQRIGDELLSIDVSPRLIHGDLHHQNILQRDSGEWIIIDPKGIHGDPAFEIAAWMYNPPGIGKNGDYVDLAKRRLDTCSEIWEIDRNHLIRWGFVGAVLSAVWSASGADGTDIGDWASGALKIADALYPMLS